MYISGIWNIPGIHPGKFPIINFPGFCASLVSTHLLDTCSVVFCKALSYIIGVVRNSDLDFLLLLYDKLYTDHELRKKKDTKRQKIQFSYKCVEWWITEGNIYRRHLYRMLEVLIIRWCKYRKKVNHFAVQPPLYTFFFGVRSKPFRRMSFLFLFHDTAVVKFGRYHYCCA